MGQAKLVKELNLQKSVQKMAKSLRSKWKRKMRAVKRVRYGEKEAKMLNKIIEGAKARREEMEKEHKPEPLGEGLVENGEDKVALEGMDVEKKASSVSAKTLKNEHGNYPVWVSKRKIANIKKTGKKNKSTKHVEGKVVKQKGVVRKRRFD